MIPAAFSPCPRLGAPRERSCTPRPIFLFACLCSRGAWACPTEMGPGVGTAAQAHAHRLLVQLIHTKGLEQGRPGGSGVLGSSPCSSDVLCPCRLPAQGPATVGTGNKEAAGGRRAPGRPAGATSCGDSGKGVRVQSWTPVGSWMETWAPCQAPGWRPGPPVGPQDGELPHRPPHPPSGPGCRRSRRGPAEARVRPRALLRGQGHRAGPWHFSICSSEYFPLWTRTPLPRTRTDGRRSRSLAPGRGPALSAPFCSVSSFSTSRDCLHGGSLVGNIRGALLNRGRGTAYLSLL